MAHMNAQVIRLPEFTPSNWDAEVGARIKALMIGRGTQEDLARATGLQQADVSKRLNGRVQWKGHELGDVATCLGVSVSVLYGEDNKKGPATEVAGPKKLVDLDSNQEPAGYAPALPMRGTDEMEWHRQKKTFNRRTTTETHLATVTDIKKAS